MAGRSQPSALPAQLARLFADGGSGHTLTVPLPAGRLVRAEDPDFSDDPVVTRPLYWLSNAPVPAGLWARLRAEHARSGLWPLLAPDGDWRLDLTFSASQFDGQDAAEVLAELWADHYHGGGYLAPFGRAWPGLAPAGQPQDDPGVVADAYAGWLHGDGGTHLGLVAADRGADAPAVAGWAGSNNHASIAELAVVVRSWEERFGVRVVRLGDATVDLSVAAPPVTTEHALQVAAEHCAFCPDNIWQSQTHLDDSFGPHPLRAYAERLRSQRSWSFWWD